MKDRAHELREEAASFDRAADFLHHQAMAKRRIADEIERIDGAGSALGGGGTSSPPRLAVTRNGGAA